MKIEEIFEKDPRREAQFYSLMAWNGMTEEQAKEVILSKSYEEVDALVHADDSIKTAMAKIKEEQSGLTGKFKYVTIIRILSSIHNKWVVDNAKKYDRGTPEKSQKKIFQHLPIALIGIDEVALDLMFLAPFLKQRGIDVGTMRCVPYGTFIPNDEIKAAYNDSVEMYLRVNNINTENDLAHDIEETIDSYVSLHSSDEISKKRREYMKQPEILEVLLESVKSKNVDCFSKLKNLEI